MRVAVIGLFSADQAHQMAVDRMGYVFAQIETTDGFITNARAAKGHPKAAAE
ncbi:MAG TPA: hypothetical protein VIX91_11370 [Candidatus Acidoferrum sp.]